MLWTPTGRTSGQAIGTRGTYTLKELKLVSKSVWRLRLDGEIVGDMESKEIGKSRVDEMEMINVKISGAGTASAGLPGSATATTEKGKQ